MPISFASQQPGHPAELRKGHLGRSSHAGGQARKTTHKRPKNDPKMTSCHQKRSYGVVLQAPPKRPRSDPETTANDRWWFVAQSAASCRNSPRGGRLANGRLEQPWQGCFLFFPLLPLTFSGLAASWADVRKSVVAKRSLSKRLKLELASTQRRFSVISASLCSGPLMRPRKSLGMDLW